MSLNESKLLEWLKVRESQSHSDIYAASYLSVTAEILSGTFDDHSSQEEIPDWEEIAGIQEARAIQAEQERDAYREALGRMFNTVEAVIAMGEDQNRDFKLQPWCDLYDDAERAREALSQYRDKGAAADGNEP